MAKSATNRIAVKYREDDRVVIFTVLNKADDKVLATAEFCFDDVHESLQDKVSLYGLNKLLTDRTSDITDKVEKLAAMHTRFDDLVAGEWAKERQIGAPVVSPEVEALARIKAISVPQAQAALAGYDKETRAKILGHEKVVELAKEIRESREAQQVVNLDDLT